MQYARWVLVTVIFVALTACSRQQNTLGNSMQPELAAHVRNPHSNSADLAVPMCHAKYNDSLASDGIVGWVDRSVTHPIPKYTPEAAFSDEALRLKKRNQNLGFTVLVGLVVDVNGNPQDVCLVRSVGYGIDANAANAVRQYRFLPATKDSKPVAERITIQIDLRTY